MLFEYWGKGLLVASVVSAVAGLLIGNAGVFYLVAGVCLTLSLACIFIGRCFENEVV
ncbi:MAG: hypothetical protein VB007_08250 [Methanocorpusculum sp.]|uniref:hypothetical protein n=1 Tax=Methanocorpusculum sp. TaxID=2058474 RepID=UPI002B1ECBED|nr:hypothetical protein [Methanocorpusculum sp.]MEA5087195.1 hypothetical protein [Methanocorpusculum sp.]